MTDTDNKSESEIELEEEIEIKKELIEEHKPVEIEKGNGLIHIYLFFYILRFFLVTLEPQQTSTLRKARELNI